MNGIIVFIVLIFTSLSAAAQPADWKKVKTRLSSGIVHVHVTHESQEQLKPYRQGNLEFRMGTGFFLDDGLIVTNQHVIEGARTITVEGVATKEKFKVELATVPSLIFDLAVLKFSNDAERQRFERINGSIQALEWAQWEEAQPGEKVSVLGFGNSNQLVATQGIISNWEPRYDAYQRRLNQVTLIRTDAAINPGNSGGPVVSASGHIVGISARYGAGENIGLLIPFSTARQVVDTLKTKGKFIKTETGLVTYNVNPVLRKILNLSVDQTGLVVSHVASGSAAEKAGIRPWDILTSVNGYQINHGEILHPQAGNLPYWFLFNAAAPETKVSFHILRGREHIDSTLTLTSSDNARNWASIEDKDYKPEWGYLGGLVISEVTRDLLTEIENKGNWRWDLVNESSPTDKIYIVSNIEADTQAISYQEYGLELMRSRVYSINGKPLNGQLSERLAELHKSISLGTAPASIVVELENNISIQLDSDSLQKDMLALLDRYPTVAQEMTNNLQRTMVGMAGMAGMANKAERNRYNAPPSVQLKNNGLQESAINQPLNRGRASPQG
jgi:S1-C subfamily serine protease